MADAVISNRATMTNTVIITEMVIGGSHGYVVAGAIGVICRISSTTTGETGKETHGWL